MKDILFWTNVLQNNIDVQLTCIFIFIGNSKKKRKAFCVIQQYIHQGYQDSISTTHHEVQEQSISSSSWQRTLFQGCLEIHKSFLVCLGMAWYYPVKRGWENYFLSIQYTSIPIFQREANQLCQGLNPQVTLFLQTVC